MVLEKQTYFFYNCKQFYEKFISQFNQSEKAYNIICLENFMY